MGATNIVAAACGAIALAVAVGVETGSAIEPRLDATVVANPAITVSDTELVLPVCCEAFGGSAPVTAAPAPLGEVHVADTAPLGLPGALFVVGQGASRALDAEALAALAGASGCAVDDRPNPTDRDAVLSVQQGRAEFAVIAAPLAAHERRAGMHATPIGVELFAVATSAHATMQSLSGSQVRKILTGEITDWSQLGHGAGAITVYVPSDSGLAERAAKAMIPGDPFAARCTALPETELLQAAQQPNALGIVRMGRGPLPANVKALAIDWSPPTIDAFRAGAYRCGTTIALATLGAPGGAAARFLAATRAHDGAAALARAALVAP